MMEESHSISEELGALMGPEVYMMLWDPSEFEAEKKPLELSIRREARKILELGKQLVAVEDNRLPSSTRKVLSRMVKELTEQLQSEDGNFPTRLVLQLANRMFDTIRRDLRPW